ncbi:hypothetical protein D6789_03825 [Candidatus Woesearchaeota archaeon]|nr:MAG: hypothetical protein D6789_03825 [Candidatus Woesearchaeota archaeon]
MPPEEETQDVEELSPEELAESNNFVLSALIDLLIKKGVIRNEELQQAMDELEKAEEEDEQSDD